MNKTLAIALVVLLTLSITRYAFAQDEGDEWEMHRCPTIHRGF